MVRAYRLQRLLRSPSQDQTTQTIEKMSKPLTVVTGPSLPKKLAWIIAVVVFTLSATQALAANILSHQRLLDQVKLLARSDHIKPTSFDLLEGWKFVEFIDNESTQYDRQVFSVEVEDGRADVDVSTSRKTEWARVFVKFDRHFACLDAATVLATFGTAHESLLITDEYFPSQRDQSDEVRSNRKRFQAGPKYLFAGKDGVKTAVTFYFGFSACARHISLSRTAG